LKFPGGAEGEVEDQADNEANDGARARDGRPLGVALFEAETERMHQRIEISDILVRYVRNGARTLSDVQQAMSAQDLKEVMAICDGAPLRDVLLDG
jgi:hypothetical protein